MLPIDFEQPACVDVRKCADLSFFGFYMPVAVNSG